MKQRTSMLTKEQVAFYQEHGYLLVERLLTLQEAQELRQECHALAQRLSVHADLDATWGSARKAVAQAQHTTLLHCHNVQFYAAAFSCLLVDERLTGAAADLMGSPNVQLHHTKMFIKPPEKGSPFPLHQDYPFFPHERQSMLAAIFHFDDAPLEKGCVCIVPGSHQLGPLESAIPCPARAGDVLFLSYLTIHGSGLNVSNEARTTLLVQMRDPTDLPTRQVHQSRGQG